MKLYVYNKARQSSQLFSSGRFHSFGEGVLLKLNNFLDWPRKAACFPSHDNLFPKLDLDGRGEDIAYPGTLIENPTEPRLDWMLELMMASKNLVAYIKFHFSYDSQLVFQRLTLMGFNECLGLSNVFCCAARVRFWQITVTPGLTWQLITALPKIYNPRSFDVARLYLFQHHGP